MLSAIEPAKRKPSCGTIPSCRRSDSWVTVAQVRAVDRDPTGARVVEAREQLRDRGLPGARVADERDGGAGGDVEVEVVEDVGELAVPEADVVEVDVAVDPRELARVGRVDDVGLLVEDGRDPVECGRRREERVVELRELLHRVEEVREVEREGEQRSHASSRPRRRASRRRRARSPSRPTRGCPRPGSRCR